MKKFLTILISLLMIVTFTGCSSSDDDEASVSGGDSQQQDDEGSVSGDDSQQQDEEDTIVFEEVTVVDNDYVTIKLTAMDDDFTFTVYLENKSAGNTYDFFLYSFSVDGIDTDIGFYETVSAGSNVSVKIEIDDDNLDVLSKFTDIGLTFYVDDDDTYEEVCMETVHVYPYGEENASTYVRETLDTDVILIDNEYVQMVATSFEHCYYVQDGETASRYELEVYLVNKTDGEVWFWADDSKINGIMYGALWNDNVGANNVRFSTIYLEDSALEEQGITEIEDLQISMVVYDWNDYLNNIFPNPYFEVSVTIPIS